MTKKLLKSLAVVCLLAGMGQAQNGNQGTLIASSTDCTTAGSCVSVKFDQPAAVGGSTVSLSGSFTATVQFEASNDGKALSDSTKTWVAINGTPANGTVAVTSATTANTWQFNVAGYTDIRARASAWTSAPTVVIRSTLTSAKSGGGGAVFASGGTTNNVIPKSNGSSALADSSITDNGTTVVSTEPFETTAAVSTTIAAYQMGSSAVGLFNGSSSTIGLRQAAGSWFSVNGAGQPGFMIGSDQAYGWASVTTFMTNNMDTGFRRRTTGNIQLGMAPDVNGSPVAQTLSVQNAITGTNLPGSLFTIAGPLGTGNALPLPTVIQGADASVASGGTAQTEIHRLVVGDSKNLTSGAATTVLSIPLATLQTTGGKVVYQMDATDGTSQCTLSGDINYSGENSAGVFVVAPSAATGNNQSNSCTATKTLTATWTLTGANPALLQVTPTLTGITATRFTLIYWVMHGGMTQPTL